MSSKVVAFPGARLAYKPEPQVCNDEPGLHMPARRVWVCDCGSTLFELRPDGAICIKCASFVRGWPE